MTSVKDLPVFPVVILDAVVQWEHLFSIDEKRTVNGKPVGDDRYNLTVLLTEEHAAEALVAAEKAAQSVSTDAQEVAKGVLKRIKKLDDDKLREMGFAYKMKTYSNDEVEVLAKQGGKSIAPEPGRADKRPYPQFQLGIKRGQHVAIGVAFRGYENSEGEPRVSCFLNAVVVDRVRPPENLPGGNRPDARKLMGHLIEGAGGEGEGGDVSATLASLIESA